MAGWKTIAVAVLQLAVYIFAWPELTNYIDPQLVALVAAGLMLVLRFFTGTEVFKSK